MFLQYQVHNLPVLHVIISLTKKILGFSTHSKLANSKFYFVKVSISLTLKLLAQFNSIF